MKKIELNDIIGKRFGKLIPVYERARENCRSRHREFWCLCQCGTKLPVKLPYLRTGDTKSCGCYKIESLIKRFTTHGFASTKYKLPKEYRIWASMIQRCENKNDKDYHYYGGRGIKVCKRWHKFELFIKDIGWRKDKKTSIDRINNNKDYCKNNCRWATKIEQMNNRSNNLTKMKN